MGARSAARESEAARGVIPGGKTVKRTSTESPVLSFCVTVRNATEPAANGRPYLLNCLESLRLRAPSAEIVILDTMSSDFPTDAELLTDPTGCGAFQYVKDEPKTVTIAKYFADVFEEWSGPAKSWTREMYAVDDMAIAREHTFALAHGRWIMWVDADDVLPDPKEVQRILEANGRWKPQAPKGAVHGEAEVPSGFDEVLLMVEREGGDRVQGFWCPYAYEFRDGPYVAGQSWDVKSWNPRERIVRNNGRFYWKRPAHEVLVPKDPQDFGRLHPAPHILVVHTKRFTVEDRVFSLRRHYDILIKQYEAGAATCQDLLYLDNYSMTLCPWRREEFIQAAHSAAHTAIDRARVQIRAGNYAVENGFYLDAMEAYAAATHLAPEYPDGWVAGARAFERGKSYVEAGTWYMRAANAPLDHAWSDIPPRAQMIETRLRAALAYLKGAQQLTEMGKHDGALRAAVEATRCAEEVLRQPGLGDDAVEAQNYLNVILNEREALEFASTLSALWNYLVRNDETIKAMRLLETVPHNLLDHPTIVGIREWAKKLEKHITDPKAYAAFYEDVEAMGMVPSNEEHLCYEKADPRTRFLIDQVKAWKGEERLTVCEFGPFDGTTLIPLLRSCPNVIHALAVEAQTGAAERLYERCKKFGLATNPDGSERVRVIHDLEGNALEKDARFDVVIFCEVIEHVPDPVATVKRLLGRLGPGGRLFMSTPWGAFDRGRPFNMPKRDPRGHVRALMPWEMTDIVEAAGGRVLELGGPHGPGNFADTMYLMVARAPVQLHTGTGTIFTPEGEREVSVTVTPPTPVVFAVSSALWDWNATHVEQTGIGASEETIVYLARQLGREGRNTSVYGPLPIEGALPLEEVRDGVKYRTRAQWPRIRTNSTVIVSRAPSLGRYLDKLTGTTLDKLLWLQDAYYPDLNPETAMDYRKVVCLSEWHAETMVKNHNVPPGLIEIIPNFLLREHFDRKNAPKREPHRFIYASSPDRGLIPLLKMWPEVLKKWPDATLGIFYGWEGCIQLGANDPVWNARYRKLRVEYLKLKYQPGIEERGRVNHAQIAQEMQRASVWAYPVFDFGETFCSNSIKARAAGCVPVTTPLAALPETADCPEACLVPYDPNFETWTKSFLYGIEQAIATPEQDRARMSEQAIEEYALETVRPRWDELLR